jgi:excisionase family DNA binding protein
MNITNTNPNFGGELLTALRLARSMREGRLILSPEPKQPPTATRNPVKVETAPITKLAVSRSEAAELLSVSVTTFDRWVAKGLIRPGGVGRRRIFPVSELQRFLTETSETIDL